MVQFLKEKLKDNSEFNDILIVYDAAAFAFQKAELDSYIDSCKLRIRILDWYSFENHILQQSPFNTVVTLKDTDCYVESLEQESTKILKSMIRYSKGGLSGCLRKTSRCKQCDEVAVCLYKHNTFSTGLIINDFGKSMEVFE